MNIKTANRLCELRKEHGLSQEELASKLGVSRQAISKWERSESSPDTDNLIELARLYGISLDELLNGDEAIEVIKENKESDEDVEEEDEDPTTYVCDEDEEVIINDSGVHVRDDEGNEVHISKEKIQFKDDDDNKVTIEGDKVEVVDEDGNQKVYTKDQFKKMQRKNSFGGIITSVTAILVIIAYLLLGFLVEGFGQYWFLFILIPVPGSLFDAIHHRKASKFAYPVFIAGVYCGLGALMGLWHPLWVLFITIPLFYLVCGLIRKIKNRK